VKRIFKYGFLAASAAWMMTGCVDTPDAEGWHPSQKEAFSEILRNDTYLSVCGDRSLMQRALQTQDSRVMSRALLVYTENLANSCIDLDTFRKKQQARKSEDFKTHYETYMQSVSKETLMRQLRAGMPISSILKPYIPRYKSFHDLSAAYKKLETAEISPAKLRKIRLNIERIKLMKPLKTDHYVLINIPEYEARLVENGQVKVRMRVVVGKRKMQTPIFSENLQYIVLNPPWNVPESIARKEILPKIIKNPRYLKRHGMEVHRTYDLSSPKVDLSGYDLCSFTIDKNATEYEKKHPKPMPFRIVQVPSKKNGLGRVKFLFPNRFSVYMHDTQSKYLFKRSFRAYSHGCIRLEKPNTMLRYLIEHYTDISWDDAKKMYDSMKTHFVKLKKPLPVHTAYLTAFVEDDGSVKFFKDIYGYDRIQKLNFP
jgi:hypothetical protein